MSEFISCCARPTGTCAVDYWRHVLNDKPVADHLVSPPLGETFGAQARLCRLGAVALLDCCGLPSRILHKAFPNRHLIALTFQLEGESLFTLNSHKILLTPGNFSTHSSACDVEVLHLSQYRQIFVLIDQSKVTKIASQPAPSKLPLSARSPLGQFFLDMLQSACAHGPELSPIQAFDIASVVTNLTSNLLQESECENAYGNRKQSTSGRMQVYHIQTIKDYILSKIADPELDVTSICTGVNLSKRYVHHLFSSEPMRLMEWLWNTRLSHCARDLSSPSLRHNSISSIAFSNGFNDQTHFSRAFRKRFGISPREFRNRHLATTAHSEPITSAPLVNSDTNTCD